jgi:Mg2+ and Co2+ transporter CorA
VAFGTSVAGVAASAMLGLVSALCRRERLLTAQILDTRIATVLRGFSLAHQRQETFKALQLQARILPDVVDKLQAMMVQMDRQSQQLSDRLLANQESHYREAKGIYEALASSVDQSLKHSLTESARMAGATIQPVVEATMSGIARETTSLHARMADTVRRSSTAFPSASGPPSPPCRTPGPRRWPATSAPATPSTQAAGRAADLRRHLRAALGGAAGHGRPDPHRLAGRSGQAVTASRGTPVRCTKNWPTGSRTQLDGLSNRFGAAAAKLVDAWTEALGKQARSGEALAGQMQQSLESVADTFAQRSSALLATVKEAHAALQAELATADRQRLTTLTQAVESMAASLQREWQAAGERTLAQQERICRTLEETARDLSARRRPRPAAPSTRCRGSWRPPRRRPGPRPT